MDTSEALDLSKENIQPLKQGRDPVKLGTALQAQTNVELHQKLLAEREQFELLIRMYDGDDPLKPHYDYVQWIEQSFPKHGPESNLLQILENTLTTFKDDARYKQDSRYAELLIKYIDTQPNPIDIYQLVYNQGLCTMCALFYKAWADELDKNNDIKAADQIYELGLKVKAQPLDYLKEAHLRFQLSVGRRMLGHQQELNEDEAEYNRQALHKLQKRNVYSVRDPTGAPGRIKQEPLGNHKNQNNVPFKVYQGDDKEYNIHGDSHGKMFPKQCLVNKENTLKPGPWSQNGGKHRSRNQAPTYTTPTFQVHEDEGADFENGHHKTSSVPRALKPRKIDNFTCPLAVFEPPDPTKRPMYCKSKVYAGGREFQFEELRAAVYNRYYDQLAAQCVLQNAESKADFEKPTEDSPALADNEVLNNYDDENAKVMKNEFPGTVTQQSSKEHLESLKISSEVEIKSTETSIENKKQTSFESHSVEKMAFEARTLHLEANTSLFHSQSFTANTKEAMNVVQEMWNSPSPAQTFGKNSRMTRAFPSSPVGLDESGVFKVPPVPPASKADDGLAKIQVSKLSAKTTPSFPIYSDEEPVPAPLQTFKIYSDDGDCEKDQVKSEIIIGSKNIENQKQDDPTPLPLPLHNPTVQPPVPVQYKGSLYPPGSDSGTIKMLAFQSDSDDSSDELAKPRKTVTDNIKIYKSVPAPDIPEVHITAPTPTVEIKKELYEVVPQLAFHDEDRYEDMTCNTKAFDFVLPSSTPLVGYPKSTAQPVKNCNNGSYIVVEDVKKCETKQDLSMIFEASKERYSSSSGSSGSKTQGSVCTTGNTSVQPVQAELLDKLAQISSNKSQGELEKSIGLLQISEPVDPFSIELISKLLSHIGYPKKRHLIGLHRFETDAPVLHSNSSVTLGGTKYSVIGELGKGNYARVLKAVRNNQTVALKQQKPAWEWEWYIVQELQSRLPPNMMGCYLHMGNGYIFKNTSILESEWAQYGSVLSVINKLKTNGKGHDLQLALCFSIQLISIIEHLHKCKIIHGDIKPDNFVLCSLLSAALSEPSVKLIDFGRSIDMALLPEGTTFTTVVTTDGFQCNEMKEGRPWTYQTDLYGLAGSIYCVLFYDYMKVVKKSDKWQLSSKIPRYMMPALWQEIFSSLLNVESCEKLPDLTALREKLETQYKATDVSTINQSINKINNTLLNK